VTDQDRMVLCACLSDDSYATGCGRRAQPNFEHSLALAHPDKKNNMLQFLPYGRSIGS
jgi:hypothetical protein